MASGRRWFRACVGTAAGALVGVAAACTSFSSADSGEGNEAGAGDATDATDANRSEASTQDAGADGSFCANAVWACDDFDHAAATWPSPPWDKTSIDDGGRVGLTDAGARSAPSAAAFDLAPNTTGITAELAHGYAGAMKGFRCSFAIEIVQAGMVGADLVSVRTTRGGAPFYAVTLSTNGFYDNGVYHMVDALPTGAWVAVVLEVTFGQPPRLLYNGLPAATVVGGPSTTLDGGPSGASLAFGINHSSLDTSAWRALYDDVRCDPLN